MTDSSDSLWPCVDSMHTDIPGPLTPGSTFIQRENSILNSKHCLAVAVVKVGDDGSQSVVDHIPRELSHLLSHILAHGGDISSRLDESDHHFSLFTCMRAIIVLAISPTI